MPQNDAPPGPSEGLGGLGFIKNRTFYCFMQGKH
jgi:hypothetical protein